MPPAPSPRGGHPARACSRSFLIVFSSAGHHEERTTESDPLEKAIHWTSLWALEPITADSQQNATIPESLSPLQPTKLIAMTIAPDTPILVCEDIGEALTLLRTKGLRVTTSRRLVLAYLFDHPAPQPAEQIATALSIDGASVYRNLEVLEEVGLVRHVHLGHGPGLYTLQTGGEHEYLYCESCQSVQPVAPAELDAVRSEIRQRFGFSARFTHFPITGTCAKCLAADPPRAGTPEHVHVSN